MKGINNSFYGKTHSKESIEKMKRNMPDLSGSNNGNSKKIIIDDKIYLTGRDAAKELGCSPSTITYRLKSDKYSNYNFVN